MDDGRATASFLSDGTGLVSFEGIADEAMSEKPSVSTIDDRRGR